MFTGLIEEKGKILSFEPKDGGAKIVIGAKMVAGDASIGDSVSVNGVCLTVLEPNVDKFTADVSDETLERTTLSTLAVGSPVNLERAVTPTTRLGGHIVQGHVDGKAKFIKAEKDGEYWTVTIGFEPEMAKYLVYKGSVCVEGISLTIAKLGAESFDIAVIPKTWELTNLSSLMPDDDVNIEVDVIAKYVERMMDLRHLK